jgi:hypothetical protein
VSRRVEVEVEDGVKVPEVPDSEVDLDLVDLEVVDVDSHFRLADLDEDLDLDLEARGDSEVDRIR